MVIQKSALVRFPAESMLELVQDVASYSEFLPWCQSSRILSIGSDVVEAELEIALGGFRKSFATRNRRTETGEIKMSLISGPFRRLEGVWTFLPLRENASKVSLNLEFELSGKIASLAFGRLFSQACNSMVSAFTQRAKDVYGRAENPG